MTHCSAVTKGLTYLASALMLTACYEYRPDLTTPALNEACALSQASARIDPDELRKVSLPLFFETYEDGGSLPHGCFQGCEDWVIALGAPSGNASSKVAWEVSESQARGNALRRQRDASSNALQNGSFSEFAHTTWTSAYEWPDKPGWWSLELALDADCRDSNWTLRDGKTYFRRPVNMTEQNPTSSMCLVIAPAEGPAEGDTRFRTTRETMKIEGQESCFILDLRYQVLRGKAVLGETSDTKLLCRGSSAGAGFEACPTDLQAPAPQSLMAQLADRHRERELK